jgi:Ca2+-binding EF-hand superfamily protein
MVDKFVKKTNLLSHHSKNEEQEKKTLDRKSTVAEAMIHLEEQHAIILCAPERKRYTEFFRLCQEEHSLEGDGGYPIQHLRTAIMDMGYYFTQAQLKALLDLEGKTMSDDLDLKGFLHALGRATRYVFTDQQVELLESCLHKISGDGDLDGDQLDQLFQRVFQQHLEHHEIHRLLMTWAPPSKGTLSHQTVINMLAYGIKHESLYTQISGVFDFFCPNGDLNNDSEQFITAESLFESINLIHAPDRKDAKTSAANRKAFELALSIYKRLLAGEQTEDEARDRCATLPDLQEFLQGTNRALTESLWQYLDKRARFTMEQCQEMVWEAGTYNGHRDRVSFTDFVNNLATIYRPGMLLEYSLDEQKPVRKLHELLNEESVAHGRNKFVSPKNNGKNFTFKQLDTLSGSDSTQVMALHANRAKAMMASGAVDADFVPEGRIQEYMPDLPSVESMCGHHVGILVDQD